MAIPAQGCVVTWQPWPSGSLVTIEEIQEIDVRLQVERIQWGALPYFFRAGELSLTGFSGLSVPPSQVLSWGTIKITIPVPTGTLVLHQGYAQILSSASRATVNGAMLFAYQFRLWGVGYATGTIE